MKTLTIVLAVIFALTVPSCSNLDANKQQQLATAAKTAVTVLEKNGKLTTDEGAAIRTALDSFSKATDTKSTLFAAADTAVTFAESSKRITPEQALMIRTALALIQ